MSREVTLSHVSPSPYDQLARTRGRGRLRRVVGRVAAVLALATGIALLPPAPQAQAAVALERVTNFGANPGGLNMYVYRPASLPANAPVVVALHGCTQSAQIYADNSGLATFADRHGFLLVFAETTSLNNANKCFNWFQSADIGRGQGEAASIRQMVAHAVSSYGADASRVNVTGLSAGGGMTAVMLAAYPDVFKAGAVMAGLPYACATDVLTAFTCMSPGVDRTPQDWAQRVRNTYPGYTGPWPRVSVWQGDNDPTVVPRNADELRDQWTQVHGLDQTPDRSSTIGPNSTRRDEYLAGDGTVAVEVNRVPAIGHGTPVDPGTGAEQCGATGTAHFIDSICSSYLGHPLLRTRRVRARPREPARPDRTAVHGRDRLLRRAGVGAGGRRVRLRGLPGRHAGGRADRTPVHRQRSERRDLAHVQRRGARGGRCRGRPLGAGHGGHHRSAGGLLDVEQLRARARRAGDDQRWLRVREGFEPEHGPQQHVRHPHAQGVPDGLLRPRRRSLPLTGG